MLVVGVVFLIGRDWSFPFMLYTPLRDLAWYGLLYLVPVFPLVLKGAMEAYTPEAGRSVVALGLAVYLICLLLGPAARDLRNLFVIPDGYAGPVHVRIDATCALVPIKSSRRVIVIGEDGKACIGDTGVGLSPDLTWCRRGSREHTSM